MSYRDWMPLDWASSIRLLLRMDPLYLADPFGRRSARVRESQSMHLDVCSVHGDPLPAKLVAAYVRVNWRRFPKSVCIEPRLSHM